MARYDEATFQLAKELRRKSVARLREAGKDIPDREESTPHHFRTDGHPADEEGLKQDEAAAAGIRQADAIAAYNAGVAAALEESVARRTTPEGGVSSDSLAAWVRQRNEALFFADGPNRRDLGEVIAKRQPGRTVETLLASGGAFATLNKRLASLDGQPVSGDGDNAAPRRASRPADA